MRVDSFQISLELMIYIWGDYSVIQTTNKCVIPLSHEWWVPPLMW